MAVFTFTNSSLGADSRNFDGITTAIQDLLITDLASNAKIRLVDRSRINDVLQEQNLVKTGAVDGATAVRLGKILGVQYAITGGFTPYGNGLALLTGRTIDIETTAIDHQMQKIQGKTDDLLSMLSQLSTQVSNDMNLAPKPGGGVGDGDGGDAGKSSPSSTVRSASVDTTPTASTEKAQVFTKVVSPDVVKKTMSTKMDPTTFKMVSDALTAMDKKNNTKAIELLKQVHAKYPDFEPAVRHLAELGVTS